jgi:hypothetical protein
MFAKIDFDGALLGFGSKIGHTDEDGRSGVIVVLVHYCMHKPTSIEEQLASPILDHWSSPRSSRRRNAPGKRPPKRPNRFFEQYSDDAGDIASQSKLAGQLSYNLHVRFKGFEGLACIINRTGIS